MKKVSLEEKPKNIALLDSTKLIVSSFLIIVIIGTGLLCLPIATRTGTPVSFIDALFTATSATCVTGLIVHDTASYWSMFGKIVILILIQIGGLGLITLATFFAKIIKKKIGIKSMVLAQETTNHFSMQEAVSLIQKIIYPVFVIELIGAILLSIAFVPKYGYQGIFMGIFHSISAFCNAGFDVLGIVEGSFNSFIGFNGNPLIIYTLSFLVIVGGLGFMVWQDLYDFRKDKTLVLQTKLVLSLSVILLLIGFIFFFIFEYSNPVTLGNLPFFQKINAAFFHSVCTRTAGFSSLNLFELTESSKVMSMILMFIGGAPGSTAGGIKITTIGILLLAVLSQIKGSNDTIIFKEKVSINIIIKALSIFVLSVTIVIIVTLLLTAIENSEFINIFFEAVSAFGTVGISTGLTPQLKFFSKLIIIITMFCGRIGPMAFAISISLRSNKPTDIVFPDGKISVG